MPPTRRNRMKNHMFSMCFPRMHKIFAMIFAIAVECSLCHNISTDSHSMTICEACARALQRYFKTTQNTWSLFVVWRFSWWWTVARSWMPFAQFCEIIGVDTWMLTVKHTHARCNVSHQICQRMANALVRYGRDERWLDMSVAYKCCGCLSLHCHWYNTILCAAVAQPQFKWSPSYRRMVCRHKTHTSRTYLLPLLALMLPRPCQSCALRNELIWPSIWAAAGHSAWLATAWLSWLVLAAVWLAHFFFSLFLHFLLVVRKTNRNKNKLNVHCAVVKYSGRRRMTMMRVCILIRQLDTGLFCAAIDRTQPPPHRTDADRWW